VHRSKAAAAGRHAGHTIADIGHGQTAETLDDILANFSRPRKNPEPYCHIQSPEVELKRHSGVNTLPTFSITRMSS
jgi:hypothetical protein